MIGGRGEMPGELVAGQEAAVKPLDPVDAPDPPEGAAVRLAGDRPAQTVECPPIGEVTMLW